MPQKVKLLYPIIALLIIVNAAILLGEQELIKYKFVPTVINGANLLLFALTLLGLLALISAAKDPNPNVLVRTVMAFMGFRLIGLAVILVSYIKMSGAAISPRSVYAGLALYPLYTWLEIKLFLKLNVKK
jgi:amino acid transporter